MVEKDVVDELYMGESPRSIVTRCLSHFDLYQPGKGGAGASQLWGREGGEEDQELQKACSRIREHTLKCHKGIFSKNQFLDYEILLLHSHTKVFKRQLEETIF